MELHNFVSPRCASPIVLVLQVDNHIGLTVARALGREGVSCLGVSYKGKAFGCYSRYLQGYATCQPGDAEEMIAVTMELIALAKPDFVMAVSESLMKQLNEHRSELPEKTQLLFAEQSILDQAFDKSRALAIAKHLGIPIPASYQPETIVRERAMPEGVTFPVVLKPPRAYEAAPWKALNFQYRHCGSAQEVLGILDQFVGAPYFPLVQQYCPGHGAGIELCMHGGEPITAFQHERIRENPPSGGVSVMRRSARLSEPLLKDAVRLLQAMEWNGVAMVEFRYDPTSGQYWLMEINGRFWGSLSLPVLCGVNFPYVLLESMGYGRLPKRKLGDYPIDVKCQQLSADLHWLLTVSRMKKDAVYRQTGRAKWQCIGAVLSDLVRWPYHDVEWMEDPLPAIQFWKERVVNALAPERWAGG
jgi:predicted ATP-grasp superfamily ATP-dependent carboligase